MRGWLLLILLSLGYAAAQSEARVAAEKPIVTSHEVTHHYARPSATQLRTLPGVSWSAEVNTMKLRYHLVSLAGFSSQGYFVFAEETRTCHIYIDTWFARHVSRAEHLAVVFHEVGHCVDVSQLRFSHNAFVREGCAYGAYYCAPAEGYAEAWRYAYTARCGLNAVAIGYEPMSEIGYGVHTSTERCTLPTAEGVRPPLFTTRLAAYVP